MCLEREKGKLNTKELKKICAEGKQTYKRENKQQYCTMEIHLSVLYPFLFLLLHASLPQSKNRQGSEFVMRSYYFSHVLPNNCSLRNLVLRALFNWRGEGPGAEVGLYSYQSPTHIVRLSLTTQPDPK